MVIFVFKQKTAYEMRISDWSSDVCSSDLRPATSSISASSQDRRIWPLSSSTSSAEPIFTTSRRLPSSGDAAAGMLAIRDSIPPGPHPPPRPPPSRPARSEEHTSELQSLMRISYAVFCLKKKIHNINKTPSQ